MPEVLCDQNMITTNSLQPSAYLPEQLRLLYPEEGWACPARRGRSKQRPYRPISSVFVTMLFAIWIAETFAS